MKIQNLANPLKQMTSGALFIRFHLWHNHCLWGTVTMGNETEKNKILAVDDEPTFLAALEIIFEGKYDLLTANEPCVFHLVLTLPLLSSRN